MTSKRYKLSDIEATAKEILESFPQARCYTLKGELGAGKTSLVKELVKALGSEDTVSSPTFSVINHYETPSRMPIFHIDLYRLDSKEEALDIGIMDYLTGEEYVFIEWADLVLDWLPEDTVHLSLTTLSEEEREIKASIGLP